MSSVDALEKFRKQHDLYSSIEDLDNLEIDNTFLTPEQVVDLIIQHFNL